MFRRSMVSMDRLTELRKQAKNNYEVETILYEAGAERVLTEIAKREIHLFREHTGPVYEEAQGKSVDIGEMFTGLKGKLPKHEEDVEKIENQVNLLELECLDAGFIAGFIAGYRFLKEMNMD